MTIQFYDLAGKDPEIMFGPFAWRARMGFLHKGVDFKLTPWRFAERVNAEETGVRTIPTIRDGDDVISDSAKIIAYLDEKFPDAPALINGEKAAAHVKNIESLCSSHVFPAAVPVAVFQVYSMLDEESQPYFRETREKAFGKKLEEIHVDPETGKANLAKALQPFEVMLDAFDFLGGPTPSYADYALFGILKWTDIVSSYRPIDDESTVGKWFVRIENMYDGHAAKAPTVRD